jgi:hypothetical protein
MSGNINFNGWINDDGTENYKCRAWVNFQGTGTVAIRASGNVSSITDNGTADYTVNFTTAMPDVNYSINGVAGNNATSMACVCQPHSIASPSVSAVRLIAARSDGVIDVDPRIFCVSIFR